MLRYRVLDLSRLLPGPLATKTLADMGCRVTQVLLPHFPDPLAVLPLLSRGKQRHTFDFRAAVGRKRLERMIARSDVLVESFRPGVLDRMGLGYESVKKLNAKLVYCSISGYAPEGPWGGKAGHDLNFLAMSGFMDGRGLSPAAQVADAAGAQEAVVRILAALLEGRGKHIQVSLTDTIHASLVLQRSGVPPFWDGSNAFYRVYRVKGGGYLAVAAMEPNFRGALLALFGLGQDLKDPAAALTRVFSRRDLAYWTAFFQDRDVCVTPVLTLAAATAFLAAGGSRSRS